MANDDRVKEILARFGEDLSATWMVQGVRVIRHSALERIAAKAHVHFEDPTIIRACEREAVILVKGGITSPSARWEWSIGEANMELNYRTSGKQQPYPYAMAEKRAKDRVILKLIELHGDVYSEEEADEFKEGAPLRASTEAGDALKAKIREGFKEFGMDPPLVGPAKEARREVMFDAISSGKPVVLDDGEVHPGESLTRLIREQGTAIGIKNLMLRHEVQAYLSGIPEDQRDELRNIAIARMADLGWKRSNG